MEEAVSMWRMALIDWVSDFLFSGDGPTDAAILLSPLQGTYAQLMTTRAERRDGGASAAVQSHWLLLPAFSVAGVSVGLAVESGRGRCPRLTRYARCDDVGSTLMVSEDASANALEAEFVRYDGIRDATRTYCRFDASFRAHLQARKGAHTVDSTLVRAHLQYSMTLRETRASCGACGTRREAAPCSCRYTFRRARHPLDFAYTARNTLPFLGDFRGIGRSVVFTNGVTSTTDLVATELRTRSGGEAGATERLLFWAVHSCLSAAKTNPLMLEMPGALDPASQTMVDLFLRADDAKDAKDTKVNGVMRMAYGDENSTIIDVAPDANVETINLPTTAAACVPTTAGITGVASVTPNTNSTNTATVRAATATSALRMQSQGVPTTMWANAGVMYVAPITIQTGVTTGSSCALPAGSVAGTKALHMGSQNVSRPLKRSWAAIAPALATGENTSGVNAPRDGLEGYSSVERRKILKREAAARSNAKRRQVVALQRQLTKLITQVELLRKRERVLRAENQMLRSCANNVSK